MTFKEELLAKCQQLVDERIELAQKLIREAQQAANQDAKSSMGDKYETSREMMALEMRKASEQLQEASKLKKVLGSIKASKITVKVGIGSLVSTSIGDFFVSVSLGKVSIATRTVFVLSAVSPLGKMLMNKGLGDQFDFNSKQVVIKSLA